MYRIYFKQAIQMLKQNMFVSIIAIMGTALAIMMIMSIVVAEQIRTISISPEINRERTYYLSYVYKQDTVKGYMRSGNVSYNDIYNYISKMETPEYISAFVPYVNGNTSVVNVEGVKDNMNAIVRSVDASYWKILDVSFIEGAPFTQEEFDSSMNHAVISKSTARSLFKGEGAMGKTIQVNRRPYRIVGIVEDVSPLFRQAKGDVWIPYSSVSGYENGYYDVMLMARSQKDYPAVYQEVRDIEKKFAIDHAPETVYFRGPHNYQTFIAGIYGNSQEEVADSIAVHKRKRIFIFIILLLVPAINLSGLSLSRIKKRTSEIGARKAFGAKKYVILIQVLYENLITSLIGGVLGLILSYIVVFGMRNWLLKIPADSMIPIESLISPYIFLSVFVVCILVNLLSAGIPAYRASRISIINSLNQNDK